MKQDIKPIPAFKSEDEEREFWATHSVVDYFDVANAYRPTEPFENLKRTEDLLEFKMPLEEMKSLDTLARKDNITRDALARNVLLEWIRRQQDRALA